MANEEFSQEDLEQQQLQARLRAKRKAKRAASRGEDGTGNLNLNSMMDMMTIILCFLLKSYGEEPIKVLPGTDLPYSTSEIIPKDMTTISITKDSIFVGDTKVDVALTDRKVDKHEKVGGGQGLIIRKLETALRDEVEKHRQMARQTKAKFEGELTIIADVDTPYRLIAEVMQTSIAAEFKKFRFAVIKNDMAASGTVPLN